MSLTIRALASGSAGNAFLVETEHGSLLLDSGLPARRLYQSILRYANHPERFGGIVVTHEHGDHAMGALALARKLRVPIYATAGTLARLGVHENPRVDGVPLAPGRPTQVDGLRLTAHAVPHDAAEPVGLLIEHDDVTIALATDLGSVDEATYDWTAQAELVIVEANHDLDRLWAGPYPQLLKRRVAGPNGHLSNEQAAWAIERAAERGRARWVWLAHLSEVNNTQRRALAVAQRGLAGGDVVVEVTRRHRPSLVWRSSQLYRQGALF